MGTQEVRTGWPGGFAPFVSVVVVTYNRRARLEQTLERVFGQTYPGERYEVLVVDNSSRDGTREWISTLTGRTAPELRYFVKEPNGPGPARNLGAEMARGAFVVFLDSDVSLAPDWLERAVAFALRDDTVGAVGGKLVYAFAPDRVNAFGGAMGRIGLAWDEHEGLPDLDLREPRSCLWANSSALLMRRDLFRHVGGFDEAFFYGYEEADLGWRVNLAGARVVCVPDALAYHEVDPEVGRSDERIVYHYCKNRLRTMLKNERAGRLAMHLPMYLLYSAADVLLRGPRRAKLGALAWNVARLGETLRLRRGIQSTRTARFEDVERLLSSRWFPPVPLGNRRRRPMDPGGAVPRPPAGAGPAPDDRVGRVGRLEPPRPGA